MKEIAKVRSDLIDSRDAAQHCLGLKQAGVVKYSKK
jgi:hypothetical protein